MADNEARKTKRKPVNREVAVQPSDWLNFSSALVVVATTSIFYFSGWIYVSTWYGFYGLNISQLQIPLQTVLVNGLPGIFASILVSLYVITIIPFMDWLSKVDANEFPPIFRKKGASRFISFAAITGVAMLVIGCILFTAVLILILLQKEEVISLLDSPEKTSVNILVPVSIWAFINLIGILFVALIFLFVPELKKEFAKEMQEDKNFARYMNLFVDLVSRQNFYSWSLLLAYFIIAISSSYYLGEFDARRGGQSMASNWKIPEVTLITQKEIPEFANLVSASHQNGVFRYGQVGLLHEAADGYYLVDLKSKFFYGNSPRVYFLPQSYLSEYVVEIEPQNDVLYIDLSPDKGSLTSAPTPTSLPAMTTTPAP